MFFFRRQYSLRYSRNSSRCMDATSSRPAKHECSPRSSRFILLSSQQDADLSNGLFSSDLLTKTLYGFVCFLCPIRATCPAHLIPIHLIYLNYVWRGVQVMKLFIMQLSAISCYFIWAQICLQCTVYRYSHPMLFLWYRKSMMESVSGNWTCK